MGQRQPLSGPAGLVNPICQCYANAATQALLAVRPILNHLRSGYHSKHCPRKGKGFCVACEMEKVANHLYGNHARNAFHPKVLFRHLKALNPSFNPITMHDSHEYITSLLQRLCEADQAREAGGRAKNPSAKRPAPTTAFDQLVGGYERQVVTCSKCQDESITFRHFHSLYVPIKGRRLSDCLKDYTSDETLEGRKCPNCGEEAEATLSHRVCIPPTGLIMTLQRFDPLLAAQGLPAKVRKRVTLPPVLDLGSCMTDWANKEYGQTLYNLVGVVCHAGTYMHAGHYVSHVKTPVGSWKYCDDESVSRSSEKTACTDSNAYVLVYERVEGKAKATPLFKESGVLSKVKAEKQREEREREKAARAARKAEGPGKGTKLSMEEYQALMRQIEEEDNSESSGSGDDSSDSDSDSSSDTSSEEEEEEEEREGKGMEVESEAVAVAPLPAAAPAPAPVPLSFTAIGGMGEASESESGEDGLEDWQRVAAPVPKMVGEEEEQEGEEEEVVPPKEEVKKQEVVRPPSPVAAVKKVEVAQPKKRVVVSGASQDPSSAKNKRRAVPTAARPASLSAVLGQGWSGAKRRVVDPTMETRLGGDVTEWDQELDQGKVRKTKAVREENKRIVMERKAKEAAAFKKKNRWKKGKGKGAGRGGKGKGGRFSAPKAKARPQKAEPPYMFHPPGQGWNDEAAYAESERAREVMDVWAAKGSDRGRTQRGREGGRSRVTPIRELATDEVFKSLGIRPSVLMTPKPKREGERGRDRTGQGMRGQGGAGATYQRGRGRESAQEDSSPSSFEHSVEDEMERGREVGRERERAAEREKWDAFLDLGSPERERERERELEEFIEKYAERLGAVAKETRARGVGSDSGVDTQSVGTSPIVSGPMPTSGGERVVESGIIPTMPSHTPTPPPPAVSASSTRSTHSTHSTHSSTHSTMSSGSDSHVDPTVGVVGVGQYVSSPPSTQDVHVSYARHEGVGTQREGEGERQVQRGREGEVDGLRAEQCGTEREGGGQWKRVGSEGEGETGRESVLSQTAPLSMALSRPVHTHPADDPSSHALPLDTMPTSSISSHTHTHTLHSPSPTREPARAVSVHRLDPLDTLTTGTGPVHAMSDTGARSPLQPRQPSVYPPPTAPPHRPSRSRSRSRSRSGSRGSRSVSLVVDVPGVKPSLYGVGTVGESGPSHPLSSDDVIAVPPDIAMLVRQYAQPHAEYGGPSISLASRASATPTERRDSERRGSGRGVAPVSGTQGPSAASTPYGATPSMAVSMYLGASPSLFSPPLRSASLLNSGRSSSSRVKDSLRSIRERVRDIDASMWMED
ncbi:hypothetical protein KIPB_000696 [Kipferlia bialata]|uniref:USP domain-containing protein n=1 Tax=Kipferlia bialata TaxID=797122 RepID=A0A9K3GDM9_9EUKA|nr:hypothetical protein KIPB_000696 [Kipferlia bialata]|eukprot:g696.t1